MKIRHFPHRAALVGRLIRFSGWSRAGLVALATTAATATAADVTSTWTSAASGNWNVAGNWTNAPVLGGAPNNGNGGVATYDAAISAVGGAYTVTLNTSATVEDLALSSANATLSHAAGTLTATNGIAISAGTFFLNGGTISSTAISLSGGSFTFGSTAGTLSSGTVLNGNVNLSTTNARLRLLTGANYTGVANLTGSTASLIYQDTQTLTGKTINLDGSGARLAIDGNNALTLASNSLVRGRGSLGPALLSSGTNGLINQGTIRADFPAQILTVNTDSTVNEAGALMEASNGGTLALAGIWSNQGNITAMDSSKLDFIGTWNNTGGTITLAAGSTLGLGGTTTTSGLGTINNSAGGTVNVTGVITNTAANLVFSAATGSWQLKGGEISGGQITPGGGHSLMFTSINGIFSNGAVFNGDLNLSASTAKLRLLSGADFTGVANLTGNNSALAYQETRTLTGKTFNLDAIGAELAVDGSTTLTLGSGTLVRGRGNIGGAAFAGGTNALVNQSTLRADLSGQTLTISSDAFTNQAGALAEATQGGTLTVGGVWTNAGQISATGGSELIFNGTWNNSVGTVTIDGTSSLKLSGTSTPAGLGTVVNSAGGTVTIAGKIDNTGTSLVFGASTGSWLLQGGEISGGQIHSGSGGESLVFTSSAGILSNGAIFNGDLNLPSASTRIRLLSGADFTGNAFLSGSSSTLAFQDTRTVTGKTFNLDGASALLSLDGSNTLTLAASTLVRGRGTVGSTFMIGGTSSLVNQGTIRADLTDQILTISNDNFINQAGGLAAATNGSTLSIVGTWSNAGQISASSGSTLDLKGTWNNSGGTVSIDATSTLTLGGTCTAASLGIISNSAGGTVDVTGKIDNTGSNLMFSASTGSWFLKGGEISGGQITPGAGGETLVFTTNSGTLSNGAILNGDLNIAASNAKLRLLSGADFTGVTNLSGTSSVLIYQESRTLTGKTFNLDGDNARVTIDGTNTLTLSSGSLVRGQGSLGSVYSVGGIATLNNQGIIRADLPGEVLTVASDIFSNQAGGLATATNGASLTLNGTWTNAGNITAVAGSTLNFNGTWNNASGTVTIDATSTLNLAGTSTPAGLGTIHSAAGGTVNLTGLIDNTGSVMAFSAATGSWRLKGGEISGGQITPGGGANLVFTSNGGVFRNGAILHGDLNLTEANARLRLFSGADFTGIANLSGTSTILSYQDTRTVSGKTFNLDGTAVRLAVEGTATLTLGSGTLVRGKGTVGQWAFVDGATGLINQGTIRADQPGQTLTVGSSVFSTVGTVSAENGGILAVTPGYLQTAGVTRVTGGTISTGTAAVRQLIQISGGNLEGHGLIESNVSVAGTLAPALWDAAGLAISGNLTLASSAVMSFDVGGTTKGVLYDSLSHTGSTPVTLAGTLAVQFANGYEYCAHEAETFVLFTSSQNLQGGFANVLPGARLTTSDGFGSFKVNYGPTSSFGPKTVVLSDFISNLPPPTLGQFATWTTTMGVPPDQDGATHDPDFDGLSNAVEYALGLHPMQKSNPRGPSYPIAWLSATAIPSLELRFRMVHPQPPDLNMEIEASPSPVGPWQRIAWKSGACTWGGATATLAAPIGNQVPVVITDVQPISASPTRFLRLKVNIALP